MKKFFFLNLALTYCWIGLGYSAQFDPLTFNNLSLTVAQKEFGKVVYYILEERQEIKNVQFSANQVPKIGSEETAKLKKVPSSYNDYHLGIKLALENLEILYNLKPNIFKQNSKSLESISFKPTTLSFIHTEENLGKLFNYYDHWKVILKQSEMDEETLNNYLVATRLFKELIKFRISLTVRNTLKNASTTSLLTENIYQYVEWLEDKVKTIAIPKKKTTF